MQCYASSGQSDDVTLSSAKKKCSALTGSARKIKDNAADWHNLLLRWEKLNDEGFKVAGHIVDLRLTRWGIKGACNDRQPFLRSLWTHLLIRVRVAYVTPNLSDDSHVYFSFPSSFLFYSSQGDELLLLDKSSFPSVSSSLQTDGARELNEECCKLKDVIDKMVISHWLRNDIVEHYYDIKCKNYYVAMRLIWHLCCMLNIEIKLGRKQYVSSWDRDFIHLSQEIHSSCGFYLPSEFLE